MSGDDSSDDDKSFRKRVEEIQKQRAEDSSTDASDGDDSPDEDRSFRKRAEEVQKQREQDRSEHEPSSVHEDNPDEFKRGASVADTPEC